MTEKNDISKDSAEPKTLLQPKDHPDITYKDKVFKCRRIFKNKNGKEKKT